jgi:hypothetical protein
LSQTKSTSARSFAAKLALSVVLNLPIANSRARETLPPALTEV